MGITLGNPIIATSGTLNTKVTDNNLKIRNLYWFQPTLESTSNLIISKKSEGGITYAELKAETSGETQVFHVDGGWWNEPYIRCVPTGTLYIYLD